MTDASDGSNADELVERLWQDPARLEPGFVAVERDLALDERSAVDLLGRDDAGRAVLLLVGEGALAGAIGRAAAALAAFHQVRTVLDHFLASSGMDVSRPPRLVLVAPRFDDPRALGLEPVLQALGAELREAEWVRLPAGGDVLQLSDPRRRASAHQALDNGSAAAGDEPSAPPSQARLEAPVPELPAEPDVEQRDTSEVTPESEAEAAAAAAIEAERLALLGRVGASSECRRLYLSASDSIRSLSSVVESGIEDEGLVCRVEGARLVTLLPRDDHLAVRVGEQVDPAFLVRDDAGLNASLNAVFSHYFRHFSGRR